MSRSNLKVRLAGATTVMTLSEACDAGLLGVREASQGSLSA